MKEKIGRRERAGKERAAEVRSKRPKHESDGKLSSSIRQSERTMQHFWRRKGKKANGRVASVCETVDLAFQQYGKKNHQLQICHPNDIMLCST